MATITFMGTNYTVDHAVKGDDYVRGYAANGDCVIAIEGVSDFSAIVYSDSYLRPNACASESCNDVKHVNGALVRRDGTPATHQHAEYLPLVGGVMTGNITVNGIILTEGTDYGTTFPTNALVGKLFLKEVGS